MFALAHVVLLAPDRLLLWEPISGSGLYDNVSVVLGQHHIYPSVRKIQRWKSLQPFL